MKAFFVQYAAELRRRVWLLKRYFLGGIADLFTLYLIFVGIYFSMRSLVRTVSPEELRILASSQVIGFVAFYFASMVLSSINNQIRQEADQGTLEQLFIASRGFLGIIVCRLLATFTVDLIRAVPLFLLLSLTTQQFVSFSPMLFLVFALVLIGVYGFSLLLGGLALLFKRTGQLPFLFQVLFLGFGFASLSQLPNEVESLLSALPFARGVTLLKGLASETMPGFSLTSPELLLLMANAVGYATIGSLFFLYAERLAKRKGLLGRY